MKDKIQITRHMDKAGDIMMVKVKPGLREKVLNVFQSPGQKIVHSDYMIALFQKTVTKMRPYKSGRAGN